MLESSHIVFCHIHRKSFHHNLPALRPETRLPVAWTATATVIRRSISLAIAISVPLSSPPSGRSMTIVVPVPVLIVRASISLPRVLVPAICWTSGRRSRMVFIDQSQWNNISHNSVFQKGGLGLSPSRAVASSAISMRGGAYTARRA